MKFIKYFIYLICLAFFAWVFVSWYQVVFGTIQTWNFFEVAF